MGEASGGDGQWLTDFLGRLGGGATPTTGQSKPMRGQRVVVRKAEPTQRFEQSGFVRPPSMFRQSMVRDPPAPARALRSLEGDLDDTTLAFFGGKTEKESKPTKKSAPKEANSDPIGNFLSRIGGGATPLSNGKEQGRSTRRGIRAVERKAEPTQGFDQSGFVRPPSMFHRSLVRAPLVGMISFFVGCGVTYALFRTRDEPLDYQPLLSA